MKVVGTPMNDEMVEELNGLVCRVPAGAPGFFPTRSHIVRAAVEEFLRSRKGGNSSTAATQLQPVALKN